MKALLKESKSEMLLEFSNSFYQDLLGYKPEKTSLQEISNSKWSKFAKQRGLNPNSSGIYLLRNQTAVIQGENPLSLFHEYFGHGLYCEQSLQGRKLIELEKRLLEEEKRNFKTREFTLEELKDFRQENQTFKKLEEFRKENLEDDFLRNKFKGYSQTYLANALALRQGLRLFTKKNLILYSQSEKSIELKGGTRKNAT